jgi:hypothetical protein
VSVHSWYFPSGKDLEKTSASNAYVETFRDNKIESLAREILQNSLDAKIGDDLPVKVDFSMMKIPTSQVPGYDEFLTVFIPEAENTWPNEAKTRKLLNKMKAILSQETVNVLKISDYNTTGLERQNWESLIEQAGSSVKANDESGGSFGIGKAAPFAVSDLRMVFYNTMNSNHTQQSIGVTKFVSFDLDNGTTTQGTGYYAEDKKTPFNHAVEFETQTRTERGTDIYIIGFDVDDEENWKDRLAFAILDSFLVSIYRGLVEVTISGDEINKSSMGRFIEKIRGDKKTARTYSDLIAYYGVLEDPNHIAVTMPAYEGYDIQTGEAILVMSNQGDNNRRALMTRSAGMKIFDQKNISGALQFSAIFMAHGKTINKELKQLENPNHDNWSKDRGDNPAKAKKLLDFIRNFVKETIIKQYKEDVTEEVDAFGVADFLPSDIEAINRGKKDRAQIKPAPTLKPAIEDNGKPNTTVIRGRDEDEPSVEIDGTEGEGGGGRGEDDGAESPGTGKGGGIMTGGNGPVGGQVNRHRLSNMTYRVIEMDATNGLYALLVRPSQNVVDIRIGLSMVGDNGRAGKVQIIEATQNGQLLRKHGSSLYSGSIPGNQYTRIELKIDSSQRLKMEVEVDANPE